MTEEHIRGAPVVECSAEYTINYEGCSFPAQIDESYTMDSIGHDLRQMHRRRMLPHCAKPGVSSNTSRARIWRFRASRLIGSPTSRKARSTAQRFNGRSPNKRDTWADAIHGGDTASQWRQLGHILSRRVQNPGDRSSALGNVAPDVGDAGALRHCHHRPRGAAT